MTSHIDPLRSKFKVVELEARIIRWFDKSKQAAEPLKSAVKKAMEYPKEEDQLEALSILFRLAASLGLYEDIKVQLQEFICKK